MGASEALPWRRSARLQAVVQVSGAEVETSSSSAGRDEAAAAAQAADAAVPSASRIAPEMMGTQRQR